MTFNIRNQNAGVINNVEGDQLIYGGQTGTLVTLAEARSAARLLQEGVRSAGLPGRSAAAAREHAAAVAEQLAKDAPDRPTVAERLAHLLGVLKSAAPLVTSAAALGPPLHTLLTWLGALGEPLAHVLATLL